jgi:fatty acid desaturase
VWSAPALSAFIFSFMGRKRLSENYKVFLVLYAAIFLLFLLSWSFIPQQIPSAILPLLFLLGFRSIKKQSESVNQEMVNVL